MPLKRYIIITQNQQNAFNTIEFVFTMLFMFGTELECNRKNIPIEKVSKYPKFTYICTLFF